MLFIETDSCRPEINLACEEYFLKSSDLGPRVCLLWRNAPTVVVGRFQNTLAEVDLARAAELGAPVVRRISGGGAVYHDLGNLCFSFIFSGIDPKTFDKSVFGQALSAALGDLGLAVSRSPRNDLLLAERKFSGNAMALHRDRLLYHGTLLYDSDLARLQEVLASGALRLASKGVPSQPSRVTNLRPHLPALPDILAFKAALAERLAGGVPVYYPMNAADQAAIAALAETKYAAWEWNFGMDPAARLRLTCPLPPGALEIELEVEHGRIRACRFDSDDAALVGLATHLVGARHLPSDLATVLAAWPLSPRLGPDAAARLWRALLGGRVPQTEAA